MRVYQFRHQRAEVSVAAVRRYSRTRKSRIVFTANIRATTIVTLVRVEQHENDQRDRDDEVDEDQPGLRELKEQHGGRGYQRFTWIPGCESR